MVDIKELMRTYVFINDPDVKQVTTKFGALLIAIGAIAAVVWVAAGIAEQGVTEVDQGPAAAEADAEGYENEECMPQAELADWKQDNQATVLSGDYEVRKVDSGVVCVHY